MLVSGLRSRLPWKWRFLTVVAVALVVGILAAPLATYAKTTALLPVEGGTTVTVTQGNNDLQHDHYGLSQYAFDFAVGRTSFVVVAAQSGTVVGLRGDSNIQCSGLSTEKSPTPGPLRNCWTYANYVLIQNDDGSGASLYMHFSSNTLKVGLGTRLNQGDPIGSAGTTGFSNGIHVHFELETLPTKSVLDQALQSRPAGWWFTRSQPVNFADPEVLSQDPDGIPKGGQVFTLKPRSASDTSSAAVPTPSPTPPGPTQESTPKATLASTERATAIPTPQPTSEIENGWRLYKSDNYRYQSQIPDDWDVTLSATLTYPSYLVEQCTVYDFSAHVQVFAFDRDPTFNMDNYVSQAYDEPSDYKDDIANDPDPDSAMELSTFRIGGSETRFSYFHSYPVYASYITMWFVTEQNGKVFDIRMRFDGDATSELAKGEHDVALKLLETFAITN